MNHSGGVRFEAYLGHTTINAPTLEEGEYMTAIQLIKKLQKVKPETEVYFENRINPCGNINDIYKVKKETYGFFGKAIPCVVIRG